MPRCSGVGFVDDYDWLQATGSLRDLHTCIAGTQVEAKAIKRN